MPSLILIFCFFQHPVPGLYLTLEKGSITHSHLLFLSASSSWFISDTREGQHHSFTSFVNLWQEIKNIKSIKTISVNIISDNDITISNMGFHPSCNLTVYSINFLQQGNKTLDISITNVTLERIYLSLEGSHMSMFVKDNTFIGSGIQINPKFNVNHQPVVVDNCTFQGSIGRHAVTIINATYVSVTNSRFQNLQCYHRGVSVVVCHDSQLKLRNVSVNGCVSSSDTISIHHSKITASYVRVKNNRSPRIEIYVTLLRADKSVLHIDNSTFEGNLYDILVGGYGSYTDTGFTTIQNTIFANNKIRASSRSYYGGIIQPWKKKVYLTNVTFTHNHGIIVTCRYSVIEMMSCEFTNNTIKHVTYDECNVTVTNSVFQGNNGELFYLKESNTTVTKSHFQGNNGNLFNLLHYCKLTVTKSHFSDNLNPDTGSIFYVGHYGYPSSHIVVDISFCTFTGNYAESGGIVHGPLAKTFVSISNGNVKFIAFVSISSCQLYNNSAITGGIATVTSSMLIIKNSTVFGNSASGDGGTLSLSKQSTLIIENSVFNNNSASGDAGVLLLTDHSTLLIENTIFTDNTCGIDGGVIKANRKSTLNITDSSFIDNRALGSDGGAIFIEYESSMVSEQCLFINNTAVVSGGAIMVLDHSGYNDTGSTFIGNIASDTGKYLNTLY